MTKKYSILCIDDEKDLLDIYEDILSESYNIIKADCVTSAIECIKNKNQEIIYIFSDYNMPEKNGFELREEILKLGHEIPFAIVTGKYTVEMATKAMELRISAFIDKPIEDEELFKLIGDLGAKRIAQLEEEREMICSFISESTPMIEEIESLILLLEENPQDQGTLNTYFRLLHTIKGTASCVGLKSLPAFTHKYEDLVSKAKEQKIQITPNFVDALLFGLDRLKFMYAEISSSSKFEFMVEEWINTLDSFLQEKNSASTELSKDPVITSTEGEHGGADLKKATSEKLAIPLDTLDNFLELSGELTILRNTIYKSISRAEIKYSNDKDIETLSSSIEDLHKITSLVQHQITEMRKISAESITRPLKRIVRDTAKEIGKTVDFHITNEHQKIDNTIAKIISNSLVHLIRNSIDHGIETPESRKNNNKNEKGNIYLSFKEDGETHVVTLSDDGAGINLKRVKEKAIEKNIISAASAKEMSDKEAFNLIFESGFSTSQQVTSISGRGVGMDMVRSSVAAIGGRIEIDSAENKGSTFTLYLPQPKSVLIMKTLLIEDNYSSFSIPIDSIVEVVKVTPESKDTKLQTIAHSPILVRFNEIIPIYRLSEFLFKNTEQKMLTDDSASNLEFEAVILSHNQEKIALAVEKVHDIEESVIRKISSVLTCSPIYSGVTYYGDDDLALVLSIEHIIKENYQSIKNIQTMTGNTKTEIAENVRDKAEYLTFELRNKKTAILKDRVQRIETIKKSEIQEFYGSHFTNYRDQVLKIISLNALDHFNEEEIVKLLILNIDHHKYGIVIDEIFEFIESTFKMETDFSQNDLARGTIIHNNELITIIDDLKLDLLAKNLIYDEKEKYAEEIAKVHNILTKEAA